MTKKQYSKTIENLTIPELLCYGIELGLKKVRSSQTKEQIVRDIVTKKPDFLENETAPYYFIKDEAKNTLEYVKTPGALELFPIKRLVNVNQRIPIAKIKAELVKEENASEHSESSIDLSRFHITGDRIIDRTVAHEVDDDQHLDNATLLQMMKNLATNSNKEKSFHFRQKIKYEPLHGIEAFIRSVESYAAANEISDKTKWIAIAKSALNGSEDGLLLQDALSPAEDADWELFKSKLQSILGNPPDYYRDYYRSFRRGTQKLGLAMSRLTQAYKRGFLSSEQALSEHDKRHIMLQFISSLDNPLRGLVKAEEKKLTFSTIADRAAELERCFGQGFGPESAAAMMFPEGRVQMVNAQNAAKTQNLVQTEMFELIKTLTQQARQQHAEMVNLIKNVQNSSSRPTPPAPKGGSRKIPDEVFKILDGYCFNKIKYGKCRMDDRCRYKHTEPVPENIKKAVRDCHVA